MTRSFADQNTEFRIVRSQTPISDDGYKINEPKYLECDACGARVLLTEEPTPGIDELQHEKNCPQRFVKSKWWAQNFDSI